MRTVQIEHARRAVLVAEEHELFIEQAHVERIGAKLVRKRGRLPVTAHERAARRAGAGLRKQRIFFS